MASIDYISKYYKLSKCSSIANKSSLKIYICNSIYEQYKNHLNDIIEGKQKRLVLNQLLKLWFFIHFNCSLGNSKLSTQLLMYSINCGNKNQVQHYIHVIENNLPIEKNTLINHYTIEGKTYYKQENEYSILENQSYLDFSSNSYKQISYIIANKDYLKLIKHSIKDHLSLTNQGNSDRGDLIDVSLMCTSNCESNGCAVKNEKFSLRSFYAVYSRLKYYNLIGQIDNEQTNKLHYSIARLNDDNRIYDYFHSIPSSIRNSRIYLDNEVLVENFDVHNARWQMMNCILDKSIPQQEKDRFYNITTSGLFYEDIQMWINNTFGCNWTREDAKLYANTYCDTVAKYNETLKSVDEYFKVNFPNIREFIRNYPTEIRPVTKRVMNKYGKIINHTTRKRVSMIYKELNKVETKIMIYGICKHLYENYGIEAITVHDGLYMKQSDANLLKANNISVEGLFKEFLNISNFI